MKHFTVHCGTFPFEILYILGAKNKSYEVLEGNYKFTKPILKAFKDSFKNILECGSIGRHTGVENKNVIVIPNFVLNPFYLGVLQHETYHAIHDIMRQVGIPFNEDTEEVFAYLTQNITTQVFSKFFNYNPKRIKGKKGYKYKKSWGMGKMSLSKHRKSMGGDNHNHSISIQRTREFNLEEERYKKLREKRKGPMYDNVIQLFRMCKHY